MITLGLEEEVQVVDAHGGLVAHDFATVGGDPPDGMLDRELHRCAIELKTRVCTSVAELVGALRNLRACARARVAAQGQRILVAGLHPTAAWQDQPVHAGAEHPHYTRVVEEYQDVARSAFSFGMHLHLGLPAGVPRIAVMNRLRHVLPEVLALSASSPFLEGRDTGLHSWRHSLLDRYPRMGVPEAWPDEAAYVGHVQRLRRVGCLSPEQGLWQDLRLHHRYGTLEVRIMDSHPDLARIALIATLLAWEAATIVAELASGRARPAWPRACIEENKWRARRHALAAQWIDWDRDEACPTAAHFERWWRRIALRARDARERAHWERALGDALAQGTFADALRVRAPQDGDWSPTLRWMIEQAEAGLPVQPPAEDLA